MTSVNLPPQDPSAADIPAGFLEWMRSANAGQLAVVTEVSTEQLRDRLQGPDALEQFATFDKIYEANEADWNSHLAATATDTGRKKTLGPDHLLAPPENYANTLPWITKVTNTLGSTVRAVQATLFNLNKQAIDSGVHEQYLGIYHAPKGPYRMHHYYDDTLGLSRSEVNQHQKLAEHLLHHVPEQAGQLHHSSEMIEPVLKNFGAALLETGIDQPEPGANEDLTDTDTTTLNAAPALVHSQRLNYGVSMAKAELMVDFYRQMQSYAEESKVDEEYFDEVMAKVDELYLPFAQELKTLAFKNFLRDQAPKIKMMLSQDGPEPAEEPDNEAEMEKQSTLYLYELGDGGIELKGKAYGKLAEALRTMKYQLKRLTPDKFKKPQPKQEHSPILDEQLPMDDSLVLPDEQGADLGPDDVIAEDENGNEITVEESGWLTDLTPDQRLAQAFYNLLLAGFRAGSDANGLPKNRGADTTMVMIMDYRDLKKMADPIGETGTDDHDPPSSNAPPGFQPPLFRSESQFGTVRDPALLRAALCDAKILPAVFNGPSKALDLGRAQRLFDYEQFLVLKARDRGCTVPGCTTPANWCQAHHALEWWEHGGETNIDNGTLVCQHHHTEIHQGKWNIVRIDDQGVWYQPAPWFRPDTTPIRNRVWDQLEL